MFGWNLYKRWASSWKKLTRLAHETSYLDYSIPSFKVPGGFGALVPREICFFHQNYQKEFFAGAETLIKCFLGIFYVNSEVSCWFDMFKVTKFGIKSGWEGSKMSILSRLWAFSATFYSKFGNQKHIQSTWNFEIDIENTQKKHFRKVSAPAKDSFW